MLAGLTGSTAGGMAIALDSLVDTDLRLGTEHGIEPALLHRLATISAGRLDNLPDSGMVRTALQIDRLLHRESDFDRGMSVIVSVVVAHVAVGDLGPVFGSF